MRLDVTRKWLLLGSVVVAIGVLLPWYADLDAFGAGDRFLGVTGPLFLVGLMVMASAIFAGVWVLFPVLGKRLPHLPVKEGALYTFLGVQDLLLLLVANSVFFHPKFGVNIILKKTQFGMVMTGLGVLIMVWSGYQLYKKSAMARSIGMGDVAMEEPEPLVKMPTPVREPARPMGGTHYGMTRGGQGPVDRAVSSLNKEVGRTLRHEPVERDPNKKSTPQPLQMDL